MIICIGDRLPLNQLTQLVVVPMTPLRLAGCASLGSSPKWCLWPYGACGGKVRYDDNRGSGRCVGSGNGAGAARVGVQEVSERGAARERVR